MRVGREAEASDIARVGRDFGFDEDDVEACGEGFEPVRLRKARTKRQHVPGASGGAMVTVAWAGLAPWAR